MSPEQKTLVKETWQKVVPIADAAARLFYERLFEIDPTTRRLFETTGLVEQRRKLIQALAMVVHELDRLDVVVPTLAELGRRHTGYGGQPTRFCRRRIVVGARARTRIGVDCGGKDGLVWRLFAGGRRHAPSLA